MGSRGTRSLPDNMQVTVWKASNGAVSRPVVTGSYVSRGSFRVKWSGGRAGTVSDYVYLTFFNRMRYNTTKSAKSKVACARTLSQSDQMAWSDPQWNLRKLVS